MRTAFHDSGFVVSENNETVGICLGYDFCAEHEFGSSGIKDVLNIDQKKYPVGLEERKSKAPAQDIFFAEYTDIGKPIGKKTTVKEKAAFLVCAQKWTISDVKEEAINATGKRSAIASLGAKFYWTKEDKGFEPEKHNLAVSWSGEEGFAINVRGEENIARLKDLHQALLNGDVCLTELTANGFLRKSGAIGIFSKIPEEIKESVRASDLERDRILKKVAETGIENKIQGAGKGWYALSPREQDDGSLSFYLNPTEQHKYASGWFTVSELEEWCEDKGPIVSGRKAEKMIEDEAGNDFSSKLLKKIKEDGSSIFMIKYLMIGEEPGIRIKSDHSELTGDLTLSEINKILSKRSMKP